MWRSVLVTVLVSAAGMGCARQPSQIDHATAEDDIREAVARYKMKRESGANKVCFLSLDEKDPSPEFLKRFTGAEPHVKPASSSTTVERDKNGLRQGVIDKETKEPGIIFSINEISWVDDSTVKVHGSYHKGRLNAAGYSYRVELKSGQWVVTEREELWIE